ncbi:MAG TPA: dipeptide ABC transporter ATP-binding protein [Limnobacter sp.]|uniref:ABC transporter ATP-binding protein n=1 Tax=Limnobacter sp. TaxID=2003368 RepID=UPI002E2F2336|nr:dipeptide ABC transporter ATP-binding protein [Limnobacter sp.]HEX5486804.1 dipeptide ABC transporter ATP-binding protein [Limnobacter sp.]
MSAQTLLDIQNLTTRLASEAGWVQAIEDLALCIERGQTFALVGESGCGKSMTALSIARLLPDCGAIVAGSVELAGHNAQSAGQDLLRISESAMRGVRGKRISMIFQEPGTSLNPVMTVGDQLTEVIGLHTGVSPQQARAEAANWLEKVGIPDPVARLAQYPFEMSGGQKQRVMIAMALAVKPDLLIADEPTTALDVSIQAQVLDLLGQLQKEQGMAMLLITHDLAIVKSMADHVGLMYAGQLVESASVDTFFAQPSHPYARALMRALPRADQRGQALYALPGRVPPLVNPPAGCRFASRCEYARSACSEGPIELAALGNSDHWVRCIRVNEIVQLEAPSIAVGADLKPKTAGRVRLEVRDLKVAYAQKSGLLSTRYKPVLKGLSFQLRQGQTVALVGESGSGKTTAARALLGLLADSARIEGQALLDGQALWGAGADSSLQWRRTIQFVFQDPFASLNPRHRIAEILEEPLLALCPNLTAEQRKARVAEVLEQVNLPVENLTRFPHEFSGGQRQRIAIARALVSRPAVLICDEPTSALDVSVQAQILNLLGDLQRQTGVAMLFITHNLAVVEYLADEVIVLKTGEVVEQGNATELFANPVHDYTKGLLAAAPRL